MKLSGLLTAAVAVALLGGCAETSVGHPVADSSQASSATTTSTSTSTSPSSTTSTTSTPEFPTMGVVPTLPDTIPPNALICLPPPNPGAAATVQISDPAAPRIVMSLPEGWSAAPAPAGLTLTGPAGMSGAVTITETTLDPAAAFGKYADDITAAAPISSVSILPADHCGFSGQRLMGVLSGSAAGSQTYEDRIAHVWTNTKDYLVVIHVTAPQGSPAFDAAAAVLTADFAVTIP